MCGPRNSATICIFYLLDVLDKIGSFSKPRQQGWKLDIGPLQLNLAMMMTVIMIMMIMIMTMILLMLMTNNYHAPDLLFELPGLKTKKPLIASGRLGRQVELKILQ